MLCTGKKMQFSDDIAPRCPDVVSGAGAGGGVGAVRRTRYISGAIIGRKLGFFYLHIFHFMYTYGGFCFIESETRCDTLLIATFSSFWVSLGIGIYKKPGLQGCQVGNFIAKLSKPGEIWTPFC